MSGRCVHGIACCPEMERERDELREALRAIVDQGSFGASLELLMARHYTGLAEALRAAERTLSRHPSQPVKGTP